MLKTIERRVLTQLDTPALWRINEQGLPGVGEVSQEAMADLLSLCAYAWGAFDQGELVGFVLCLQPGTRYTSLNYAWFNQNHDEFLYVDRIAVADTHRNRQIGSALYEQVIKQATERGLPVAAEVNLTPPNPGSMRFHQRHGFAEVGTLEHPHYAVAMLMRPPGRSINPEGTG